MKTLFAFIILIFVFQVSLSQEGKVFLIDKFGKTNCENDSNKLDELAIRLQENPNSKGYVVIYWEKQNQLYKFFYEQRLKGYLFVSRGLNENRVQFLRGEIKDEGQIELWIAEDGISKPSFTEAAWNYNLPTKRIYKFYSSAEDDGVCDSHFSVNLYSKFLLANSDRRGHIVIFSPSKKLFQKTKNEIWKDLIAVYKISPKHIKFFFVKDNTLLDYTREECWFVHVKNRK